MSNNKQPSKKLGLWATTALVVGSMIGSGIFSLPVSLAEYGGISLFGWLLAAISALILAKIFAYLSKVIPSAGGPYAYSRVGFGDFIGFFVAWGYWLSIWATNAAITITFISYLGVFFPVLQESTIVALIVGLITIWSLTAINSYSVKAGGNTQVITTILKIVPLAVVTIGGLFFLDISHFTPFNVSEVSSVKAITICTALCLFAFMGLEAATVPATNVDNPKKTIPKATMLGTILVTVIYMLSSFSLFAVLSPAEVANTASPFASAASKMWGGNAEYLIAAGACISTLGALNGWILIQGQIPMAMAKDGLFPKAFAKTNKNESPYFSIIASSIIITVLLFINQSDGLSGIYTSMVLLTTVTVLVSYIFTVAAYALFSLESKMGLSPTFSNLLLAILGFAFTVWMMVGSGEQAVFLGFIGLLLGIPVYIWNKRKTPQ